GWEGGASFSQGVFSFYIRDAEVAEVILILHFAALRLRSGQAGQAGQSLRQAQDKQDIEGEMQTDHLENFQKFNMLLGRFPRILLSGIRGKIALLCVL
ncbi:hypothetical protein D3OALGB2SA_2272, partial [Olavius algarvensis associated proteobacterium Delta 3]